MKILFFAPALNSGGAERVIATISNELAKNGDQVEILLLNSDSSFYTLREEVSVVGLNEVISTSGIKRALSIPVVEYRRKKGFVKEVNRFRPDIVISFLYTTNVLSLLSKNKLDMPLIVSERNDPTKYGTVKQMICRKLYPAADRIVCQGSVVEKYYQSCGGRCTVIPNPVNAGAVGAFRSEKKHRIVTVGRLTPAKNHKLLIDAFDGIKEAFPDYTLEIYGEGELRDDLNGYIESLGLSDRVFLMGSRQNVMAELNDATCFVLSSDYEGFPNVLVEAMSTGIPVISTDFPSRIARELIRHGENGFLFPTNGKEELIPLLRKLLSDAELQQKFARSNLDVIHQYSEANIAKSWRELCEEVIQHFKAKKKA